jgi:hypothetical protein
MRNQSELCSCLDFERKKVYHLARAWQPVPAGENSSNQLGPSHDFRDKLPFPGPTRTWRLLGSTDRPLMRGRRWATSKISLRMNQPSKRSVQKHTRVKYVDCRMSFGGSQKGEGKLPLKAVKDSVIGQYSQMAGGSFFFFSSVHFHIFTAKRFSASPYTREELDTV